MKADETQVGGSHYNSTAVQHWNMAADLNLGYFEGQISKYMDRWKRKNGLQDLRKAQHFLAKLIEVYEAQKTKEIYSLTITKVIDVLERYTNSNQFDDHQIQIICNVCTWRLIGPSNLFYAQKLLNTYIELQEALH